MFISLEIEFNLISFTGNVSVCLYYNVYFILNAYYTIKSRLNYF